MLLALVILLFPAPQAHGVTSDSGSSKPVISAAVRPLALPKDASHLATRRSAEAPSPSVPEIALSPSIAKEDVPAILNVKNAEPPPPASYFPEAPVPHLAASSGSMNTFEAPIKPAARALHRETLTGRSMWYGLMVAGHAAAALDAYSTRRVVSQNLGTERNPLLRPFANSNTLYVAVQASPLVMDFIGRKMMTSEHGWVRHMWWLPQSAGTVASILSGVHNLRIANK